MVVIAPVLTAAVVPVVCVGAAGGKRLAQRIEVEDLLERYTSCIDAKDWAQLDTVFTPDAILDYSSSGGPPAGPYPEIKAWLQRRRFASDRGSEAATTARTTA